MKKIRDKRAAANKNKRKLKAGNLNSFERFTAAFLELIQSRFFKMKICMKVEFLKSNFLK